MKTGVHRPRVRLAPYPRLLVAYIAADDLVLVLTPAHPDQEQLLDLASVVLPDHAYRGLLDHLAHHPVPTPHTRLRRVVPASRAARR